MPSSKTRHSKKVLCGNNLVRLVAMENHITIQAKGKKWRDAVYLNLDGNNALVKLNAGHFSGPVPLKIKSREKAASVELSGKAKDHAVSQIITLGDDSNWIEIETSFTARRKTFLRTLSSNFLFAPDGKTHDEYKPLEYQWIPNIRKRKNHVVADQIFRSPAVILCTDEISAALVPDLDFLKRHRPMETVLDLRLTDGDGGKLPLFGFGFGRYRVDGHLYFAARPEAGILFRPGEEARLRFMLQVRAGKATDTLREAVGFLWRSYGEKEIASVEPQTIPYERYAEYGADCAMNRGGIWREFDAGGRRCGGTIAMTFASRRPHKLLSAAKTRKFFKRNEQHDTFHRLFVDLLMPMPRVNDITEFYVQNTRMKVPPIILFHSWHNNLRSAYGLHWFGRRLGDDGLVERARLMKNLVLAAPRRRGVAAAACIAADDGVFWYEGTKAFQPFDKYHTPCNSWTGWWMLRWHRELEKEPELLERCVEYGDFLLEAQKDDGSIPSWLTIKGDRITPSSTLERSAQTAAPGMFLARLGRVTQKKKYVNAAADAAEFLKNEVIPGDRWFDYETFFSCSKKSFNMTDARFPIPPQNNLCLFWATEMFRQLYLATGEEKHLDTGRDLLDRLCLYQQVWNAPHVGINTFGGFGVMNTDGEWNDSRQSMFAETLMDYYHLTGNREYFERGVAALRSSFTLMLIEENRRVAPGNIKTIFPKDLGATYENYAHNGFDRRIIGYVMFDWGTGGAMTSAARALERYGDFLIDAGRKNAFGINLCTIQNLKIRKGKIKFNIDSPILSERKWKGKIINMQPGNWEVNVNGKAVLKFEAKKSDKRIGFKI